MLTERKIKKMVQNYGEKQIPVKLKRERFCPEWDKGSVITQESTSTYAPIYDKGNIIWIFFTYEKFIGIVDQNLDVYPYGYIGPCINDPLKKFSIDCCFLICDY